MNLKSEGKEIKQKNKGKNKMTKMQKMKIKKSQIRAEIMTKIKESKNNSLTQKHIVNYLSDEFGVSSRSTRRYLSQLTESGKVEKVENNRRVSWKLIIPKPIKIVHTEEQKKLIKKEKTNNKTEGKKRIGRYGEGVVHLGIVDTIIDCLKKPITKKEIHAVLCEKFPERSSKSMLTTIHCQVPTRLFQRKKIELVKNGKMFHIKKTKK